MSEYEESTVTTLRTLFDKVETLRQIHICDMLEPATYTLRKEPTSNLCAFTTVEDTLDTLGMKLEYHHWRLKGALEEIRPLL
ncbi:MAG: hypothetical protein NVS4B7_16250 [Ktedonobacteraceae bacterium]